MSSLTWRRALQELVTVKRSAATVSASGASRTNYVVVAEHVQCSLQDAGGRMRQDDAGRRPGKRKSALFGAEALDSAVGLRQDDLVVCENFSAGEVYRVVHVHPVAYAGALHHVEAQLEQLVAAEAARAG